jgi:hypothetical protein
MTLVSEDDLETNFMGSIGIEITLGHFVCRGSCLQYVTNQESKDSTLNRLL